MSRNSSPGKNERHNNQHLVTQESVIDDELLEKMLVSSGIAGRFRHSYTCDSTNDVLKKLSQSILLRESQRLNSFVKPPSFNDNPVEWANQILAPRELPFVLVADEQTAGRGRQSNTWWTGSGSLALSMLLNAKQHGLKPQHSAHLSLAIGLATMQALKVITKWTLDIEEDDGDKYTAAMPKIEIRWPNDVYVNDRKITGILIEAPNMHHIVIGIGVNTNNSAADAPEEIREKISTLSDVLGRKIDQPRFIYTLCREIMDILNYFPSQLSQLIENVEASLYQMGKMVNISRENEQVTGKCLGLNPDGALRVLTEAGEVAVVSGVVI